MPTYEYRCDQCDRTFDVVQSFHDDPINDCPTCGAPVRKVFGNVGIVFKGSGFYKTDSRTGGSSKPRESTASSTSGESTEKGGTSGAGGESKSAEGASTSTKTANGSKSSSPSSSPADKAKST